MLRLTPTRLAVGIKSFSTASRVCNSSPIFDPSQLNPLSNSGSKNANDGKLQLNIPKSANATGQQQQQQQQQQRFSASFMLSPKEDALGSRLTGVRAGRTVDVFNNDTAAAFRQLNSIAFANKIAQDRRNQRYHLKAGKARELRRSQKHRRDFMKGFKRLIEIVKDAKRKGY